MLLSALMNGQYFKVSAVDPLAIFTLCCPCRIDWLEETQAWLVERGLVWEKSHGIPQVKFNDTATLVMFKLAFAGTLSHKCRH